MTKLSGELMRWRLRLGKFLFNIVYKKRNLNTQSDVLSRLTSLGYTIAPLDDEILTLPDENKIKKEQAALLSDSDVSDFIVSIHKDLADPSLVPVTSAEMLR